MPSPRQVPLVFLHPDVPRFAYVFRRWDGDPADRTSSAAAVVVVSGNRPRDPLELLEELESVDLGHSRDYMLVDMRPESAALLCTWDPFIEGHYPEPIWKKPAKCYKFWWDADECIELEFTG